MTTPTPVNDSTKAIVVRPARRYTQGPWGTECGLSSDAYNIRYINGPGLQKICDINHRVEMSQEEALANAELIVMAPEMIEALELLHEHCRATSAAYRNGLDDTDALYTQVATVIAKAKKSS